MTVKLRISLLAAFISALTASQTLSTNAQSFYDTITAVARTPEAKANKAGASAGIAAFKTEVIGQADKKPANRTKTSPTANPPTGPRRLPVAKGNHRFKAVNDPKLKSWPHSEVQIARARCRHMLRSIEAEFTALEPIKRGPCGDPAPVRLKSLGSKPKVTFDPPATLNCDMVVALNDWLEKDLQPSARRHLKAPIVNVDTMSSYSCRNAYGRRNSRLSQHARANAIDIGGFKTAAEKPIRLVRHWGPTRRDIRAAKRRQERAAQERIARARAKQSEDDAKRGAVQAAAKEQQADAPSPPAPGAAEPASQGVATAGTAPMFRPSLLDGVASMVQKGIMGAQRKLAGDQQSEKEAAFGLSPSRLGGPRLGAMKAEVTAATSGGGTTEEGIYDEPSWPLTLVAKTVNPAKINSPRARFLREAHRSACRRFGTVLGPEANNAHRNHFHVDLAARALGNYCR